MVVVRGKNGQSKRVNRAILRRQRESTAARDADHVPCSTFFSWKSILDWMLAVVLLVLLFPLIGILMAIVRLTSSGPGLFRQARTGKNQKSFTMYKIRTMAENAEAKSGPIWARVSDSRVTAVGHVLRKLHLDELPQLFNVLKGEMSLVGPRPERPEFIDMLAEQISGYKNRLAEKPGITGLAQLNLPPDSDLKSVRYKLVLDLEYLRQASFFLDIRIILCTALRVVKLPERMSLRFFGLHRSISNEQLERHKPPVEKPATAGHRRIHPASDVSLEGVCPPALSESMAEFMKQLLNDADMDDPKVQRCVERTMHRSREAALQHAPSNSEANAQPGTISE